MVRKARALNSTNLEVVVCPLRRDKLCSKVNFVVNQILVFQISFCGKSAALRQAVNRYENLRSTKQKQIA